MFQSSGFKRINRDLHWDGINLQKIGESFGTPLFVFNPAVIEQNCRMLLDNFNTSFMPGRVFFSAKTYPVQRVFETVAKQDCGIEVISERELSMATELGIPGEKLIANGTVKSDGFLERAVDGDLLLINVESLSEIKRLREITDRLNKNVSIGLRINPAVKSWRFNFSLSTASAHSHIGLLPGSEELNVIIEEIENSKRLKFRGLHFHLGTGIRKSRPYKKALDILMSVWKQLHVRGLQPEYIDIGGGFSASGIKQGGMLDLFKILAFNKPIRPPEAADNRKLLQQVADNCRQVFERAEQKYGLKKPKLITEPGRAISGNAQLLLLTVERIIERNNRSVVICDRGSISISLLMALEYHGIETVREHNQATEKEYCITGNMPLTLDLITPSCTLPELQEGDILAVKNTGAYFNSLNNTFGGPPPGIAEIYNGSYRLLKKSGENDLQL